MFDESGLMRPLSQLRDRHSSKWRRYPADVIPMHVAEMDYEIAPSIKALLIDFIQRSDIGYLGPIPEVGEALAGFANRHWNWQPDPKQIRIATDVGVGTVEILRALAQPGDSVVINSPVYSSFYGWVNEAKCQLIDVPMVPDLETWRLDVAGIAAAFEAGAKFLLLCSPQNPMGRVHAREELAAIAELALQHGVTVISDEIHAPLTYADQKFVPWLAVSDAAREVGVVVTAASKSFNLAGLKASVIVTQSETMSAKTAGVEPAIHWRSGILGGFAMAEAYSGCDEWLHTAVEANQSNRDLLTKLVSEQLPTIPYWVPQGGYLAWLDLSSLNLGTNPAARILAEHKIALVPGSEHGPSYDQFVRINFACSPDSIQAAVAAIASYR